MFFNGASFGLGFVAGFGSGAFLREASHGAGLAIRPVVKMVVKSAILTAEKARESMAVVGESFEDLVVEARAEMDQGVAEATETVHDAVEPSRATGTDGMGNPSPRKGRRHRGGDKSQLTEEREVAGNGEDTESTRGAAMP